MGKNARNMDRNAPHELLRTAMSSASELLRFFKARIRDAEDAQDLMQELYLTILRVPCAHEIRHPKAYLFAIAGNIAHQHWHRTKAQPTQISLEDVPADFLHSTHPTNEASEPEAAAMLAERLTQVEQRLNELSAMVQAAVLWHHRDGYTCDEIGERLSVVTHRVKKYLVRGLTHCRAMRTAADLA
jgi:RNA polymerase sigma-70 factor (ECF subfamily)